MPEWSSQTSKRIFNKKKTEYYEEAFEDVRVQMCIYPCSGFPSLGTTDVTNRRRFYETTGLYIYKAYEPPVVFSVKLSERLQFQEPGMLQACSKMLVTSKVEFHIKKGFYSRIRKRKHFTETIEIY